MHVESVLAAWGFGDGEVDAAAVRAWMDDVRACPLPLGDLATVDRALAEMSSITLGGGRSEDVQALLARFGYSDAPLSLERLDGVLRGFVDLVVEHDGRFWIVDYKSNWLGNDASAYTPEALAESVREHRYDLQYLIYSVALRRLLRPGSALMVQSASAACSICICAGCAPARVSIWTCRRWRCSTRMRSSPAVRQVRVREVRRERRAPRLQRSGRAVRPRARPMGRHWSPRRSAWVVRGMHLSMELGRQHSCIELAELDPVDGWPAEEGLRDVLVRSGLLSAPERPAPLVLDGSRLYLSRFHDYETLLATTLLARAGARLLSDAELVALAPRIAALFPSDDAPDWQRIAVASALDGRLAVIAGGPARGRRRPSRACCCSCWSRRPRRPSCASPRRPARRRRD